MFSRTDIRLTLVNSTDVVAVFNQCQKEYKLYIYNMCFYAVYRCIIHILKTYMSIIVVDKQH